MNKLAIRPLKVQKILQSGTGYRINFAPKGDGKHLPSPAASNVIELLKETYPELAQTAKNQNEFLGKLLTQFKKDAPKGITHKQFASRVINNLSKNEGLKQEIDVLANHIYA